MSFIKLLPKYILIGYVGLVALLFVCQRSMTYHPSHLTGTPAEYKVPEMREVFVDTADGLHLRSWYAPPAIEGKPVVVEFQGNAGHLALRSYVARMLLDRGYGVLLVGYRGFSSNPGTPTESGLYQDARANINWVKGQGLSFMLQAESLGTGVAVQMATEYPEAKALILEAPYSRLPDVGALYYPFVPVRFLMLDRFNSLSKIASIKMPLLIVQGLNDEVIPVSLGQKLFAAAQEPKQALWIPGAGHNNLYAKGAGPVILEFISQH